MTGLLLGAEFGDISGLACCHCNVFLIFNVYFKVKETFSQFGLQF